MQPTAGLAPKWWFLAGGAFACLGSAPLTLPFWAEIGLGQCLLPVVYHAEISTFFEVKLPDRALYCEIKVAWSDGQLTKKKLHRDGNFDNVTISLVSENLKNEQSTNT